MTYYPTAQQTGVPIVLANTAGERAVFNDPADPDYVGVTAGEDAITGLDSPDVRSSAFELVEADGGVFGNAYHGLRPLTISGFIAHSTVTERNTRETKLRRVVNGMMRSSGTVTWTPSGSISQYVNVRKQQPTRIKGAWQKAFFVGLVAADPNIYSATLKTATIASATPTAFENQGSAWAPPQLLRITGPGTSPTVTRTYTEPDATVLTALTPLPGLVLAGGEYVDVDFVNKTITKSNGANLYAYFDWTTGSWWGLGPGGNSTLSLTWASGSTGASTLRVDWRDTWL